MSLRKRIESWLLSSNCNCSDGVYCTFCELLSDVLDYMDKQSDNESDDPEEANHVDVDSGGTDHGSECVGVTEAEAGNGSSTGAGEAERSGEGQEPPEAGEKVNETMDHDCNMHDFGPCVERAV